MKRMNTMKMAMLLVLAFAMILSGCSTKSKVDSAGSSSLAPSSAASVAPSASAAANVSATPAADAVDTSKTVELVWYYPNPEVPKDLSSVQDAANKIIKAKINATVKLMPIPFGDYNTKMNTIVASGEKTDIIWTSSWAFDVISNSAKGAFAPLDDLIAKYGKDIFSQMPPYMASGIKIAGVTYGIPSYQIMASVPGFIVQQEYIDKYGFDTSTVKRAQDMEPLFAKIKAGSPGVIPIAADYSGPTSILTHDYALANILSGIAVVRKSDPYKVLKQAFLPEYEQYLDMVRGWYTKGYLNQDAATTKSLDDLIKTGKVVSNYSAGLKPGGEAEAFITNGGHKVKYIPTSKPEVTTSDVLGTLNAISATSPNKERAMMLLNLVNTDKDLFNILTLGIEGKHYTLNADGTAKTIKDGGYVPNAAWVMGNTFNGIQPEGSTTDVFAKTKEINETAEASPVLGFVFDAGPVTAQIANVTNVNSTYQPALDTGTVDKSTKLAEYRDKLTKAGIDDIITELQKQLDAWVLANKK